MDHDPIYKEFFQFLRALGSYFFGRLAKLGLNFEGIKNSIVDALMVRRGANTSAFVHLSILGLSIAVLVGGGFFTSNGVISGSFPGVPVNPLIASASEAEDAGVITSTITPVTIISDKPRDKIIDYTVESGDTVSSVAEKFQITDNTIVWANGLSDNATLKEGQTLKILPVPGVSHTVEAGDTIYSIAKTYQANAQAILDFPFNDIGDNFALSTGQTLIIPDGAPPAAAKPAPTQYLAEQQTTAPVANLGSSQFVWPASGTITQYFSWYHPGDDIANLAGGPIHAADAGTVTIAGWDNTGYGNTIVINHGN